MSGMLLTIRVIPFLTDIQDHVVSGVLLTKRDTWLTKDQYTQLVYVACNAWQVRFTCMHECA